MVYDEDDGKYDEDRCSKDGRRILGSGLWCVAVKSCLWCVAVKSEGSALCLRFSGLFVIMR